MTALARVPPPFWNEFEPDDDEGGGVVAPHSCYSKLLKTDLVPGTFVLLVVASADNISANSSRRGHDIVARIVRAVGGGPPLALEVNIFRRMSEVVAGRQGQRRDHILLPQGFRECHLRHIPEIVQTTELRIVAMTEITNLAFVFTAAALQDTTNFYFTCQGMANAFLLRYRVNLPRAADKDDSHKQHEEEAPFMIEISMRCCLPFPSCYANSRYYDCFARRIWNNLLLVKLEIMKLLGRYSQQQGLFGRECARLYMTAETWGFICLQCKDVLKASDFGSSKRHRVHRTVESGLVVKAARIQKLCTVMRFSTKTELKGLCRLLGESVTAGQRCRLPKSSEPKSLLVNDVINVVCGSDERESDFIARTPCDGIDFEFDGMCELFITVRYSRYVYSKNTSIAHGCDPLLYSLIARSNPYVIQDHQGAFAEEDDITAGINGDSDNESESAVVVKESEFQDGDGQLWRVTHKSAMHVVARCIYPKHNNTMHGCLKSFDLALARRWIRQRLAG
jgi:hypothetical protein